MSPKNREKRRRHRQRLAMQFDAEMLAQRIIDKRCAQAVQQSVGLAEYRVEHIYMLQAQIAAKTVTIERLEALLRDK